MEYATGTDVVGLVVPVCMPTSNVPPLDNIDNFYYFSSPFLPIMFCSWYWYWLYGSGLGMYTFYVYLLSYDFINLSKHYNSNSRIQLGVWWFFRLLFYFYEFNAAHKHLLNICEKSVHISYRDLSSMSSFPIVKFWLAWGSHENISSPLFVDYSFWPATEPNPQPRGNTKSMTALS